MCIIQSHHISDETYEDNPKQHKIKMKHNSPSKSKVVCHVTAAATAVSLVEPQIHPTGEQAPSKHDWKRWVNCTNDPSENCSNQQKKRNVQVAQLAERRTDKNVVRHCLLNCYRKAGKIPGHTVHIVIKQEVCVLHKQVQKQVSACCENCNRQVDDNKEYYHFQSAPEWLKKFAVEEHDCHITEQYPTMNLQTQQQQSVTDRYRNIGLV